MPGAFKGKPLSGELFRLVSLLIFFARPVILA